MDLYIKNASVNGKNKNILILEGIIKEISPQDIKNDSQVFDAGGMTVLPSFFNTHTHAAMTLLRGYADDMFLMDWLTNKIWPAESKLTADDIYWGSKLACLEMIKSGTTFFNDMYWHCEETVKAAVDLGMRGAVSGTFISKDGNKNEVIQNVENTRKKILNYSNSNIIFTLGPHAIYTVSRDILEWAAEFAKNNDLIIHTHISETKKEYDDCIAAHNMKPIFYLDKLGLISPKTILAHAVWLDDDEIELLAAKGVTISHNPVSNMKLAVGKAMDYKKLNLPGINITLGTDGCSSNNNLDMLESMKFASLLQKFAYNDSCRLTSGETFQMATNNGAKAFGINAGLIEPGFKADMMLIKNNTIENTPGYNIYSDIVYSMKGSCIDTVICDGKIIMRNSQIEGEEEIIAKAREAAKKFKNN